MYVNCFLTAMIV